MISPKIKAIGSVVTSFLLQICLCVTAIYGVLNEVPREPIEKSVLVGLCLVAAAIAFALTVIKMISDKKKDEKLDEMHANSDLQKRMIQYLMQNARPSEKAVEQIERAAANIGCYIGFPGMTVFSWKSQNGDAVVAHDYLAFKQNDNDEYFTVFFPMRKEEIDEVYFEAKDINDPSDVRKAFKTAFIKKVAFASSNEYLYEDIKDYIREISRPACVGCASRSSKDVIRSSKDVIFTVYLKRHPKAPNDHTLLKDSEGRQMPIYVFTKDQFDSLVGTTKLVACQKICEWFIEAGIDITGR